MGHWKQQSSQSEWRPSHQLMEQVPLLNNKQESLPLTKAMLQHHSKVSLFNKARGTLHPLHKATHHLRNKDLVLHLNKALLHRKRSKLLCKEMLHKRACCASTKTP